MTKRRSVHPQNIHRRSGPTPSIAVRISDDELTFIEAMAARDDLSLSMAIRRCIQNAIAAQIASQ